MAIAFARARYISRASGGNAVRSAAYNGRERIEAERTGEVFYFRNRDAPEHHEVLLPESADARLAKSAVLWNAAEAAERRKDSQVAREIVLALPADRVLSTEDRIELARTFVQEHFVVKGLAVQLDVHAPHREKGEGVGYAEGTGGDHTNWHAHLLITTRRIEGDRFSTTKARDLDPEVRSARGRAVVSDGEAWGETWRIHQDRYFAAHGIPLQVDPTAAHPGEHIGPVRMRTVDSPAIERAATLRTANEAAAHDPEKVLTALTRNSATFTERELDRYLAKHLGDGSEAVAGTAAAREIAAAKAAVMDSGKVVALYDAATGETAERFTTTTVRTQERAALAEGAAVAAARHHRGVGARHQEAALAVRTLRNDQRTAFEHAVSAGGLKLIEGRAGTGKSFTLAAVRQAYELAGHRVVGLAPTNAVAQDMKADSFGEAGTVHAALFAIKNGRSPGWNRRTVLVVDEAAMLDSTVTGELLTQARAAGAKVILAGDDRQLASIERGGLFSELRRAHGAAEITAVTRQKVDWQRQAARDLAEGRFDSAVQAFDRHGAVSWTVDQESARSALVARWKADTAADPQASRFVFAYTNVEVARLNAELRQVRRDRGELGGPDVTMATKHGEAAFAVGDRIQFTDTAKKLGIYNGNAGTITGLDARTGRVTVRLDGAAGSPERGVAWSAADAFEGFRHGYAGTIYKGQGRTLDHTYLLHTHHWRAAASYVALTRQRHSAQVFVATDTARDARDLARQMARGEVRAASVAWATVAELQPELRQRAEATRAGEGQRAQGVVGAAERPADASVRASQAVAPMASATPREWLIPPYVDSSGQQRDSLNRGTSPGEVAAAVAVDGAAQRERAARWSYLQGAYKDPHGARAALDKLVKREGWTSAAARLAREPEQIGELRGKVGLFAGGAAKAEREAALRAAEAVAPSLERIGAAEGAAERTYRGSVESQRSADAIGVPRLSAAAEAAIGAIGIVAEPGARAEAWRALQADAGVAGELRVFRAAVTQRYGEESMREILRDGVPAATQIAERLAGERHVAAIVVAASSGERAAAAELREAERMTQQLGPLR